MRCIIVDDEEMSRHVISELCAKIDDIEVIAKCSSALDAINVINSEEIDLMFLDIEMPDLSGIDLIRSVKNLPQIIFTTSNTQYAVEAFEYDVTDYLMKPVVFPRFLKAVTRAKNKAVPAPAATPEKTPSKAKTNEEIFVKVNSRFVKLNINDILWLEARGDYVLFKTEGKSHLVHTTLKKISENLPDEVFVKIHRSYIVNINKIVDIEDNTVLIKESVIPISRSNRETLLNKLNLFK